MKITVALLALAGALDLLVWWAVSGWHWFTLDKVAVVTQVKDDFGDIVSKTEWVERFVPGLLDFAGPGAAGLGFAAVTLLWMSRRDLSYSPGPRA